jgi:hypothetical protein
VQRGPQVTAHDTLTAAVLVREIEQHMLVLLADPSPLEKAPHFFLDYWIQILRQVQVYLALEP